MFQNSPRTYFSLINRTTTIGSVLPEHICLFPPHPALWPRGFFREHMRGSHPAKRVKKKNTVALGNRGQCLHAPLDSPPRVQLSALKCLGAQEVKYKPIPQKNTQTSLLCVSFLKSKGSTQICRYWFCTLLFAVHKCCLFSYPNSLLKLLESESSVNQKCSV